MYEVVEDQESRRIKQLSIFLPNRLGALLPVIRLMERHDIHINAMSIVDAADHAVVRIIVDRPVLALQALEEGGYGVCETDLLGVALPSGSDASIRSVLSTMLMAELNVFYVYSLITYTDNKPVLALYAEDLDTASKFLVQKGLELIGQDELR